MKQAIIGAVVAGPALFFWGFLYWGLNPLPYSAWGQSTDDAALGESLKQFLPESGAYYVPGSHLGEDEMARLHEAGPLALIFFTREGAPVMDSGVMLRGLVHNILFAFLLALLLQKASPAVTSYAKGVKFCLLLGVAAGFLVHFGDAIWWRMAWNWQLHKFLYTVTAFVVSGAVLLKFVHRKT